jgi:AraC-like DNA-binding protein
MKRIAPKYETTPDSRTVNPETCGLAGVAQLGVSRFQRARLPTEPHIHHNMMEIGFCSRSSLTLEVAGQIHPIMPGDFFINRPNKPHHLTNRPANLCIYSFLLRTSASNALLGLPQDESLAIWQRLMKLPPTVPTRTHATHVAKMFAKIFELYDGPKSAYSSARMRNLFLSLVLLLLELSEHRSANREYDAKIVRIAEAIAANPGEAFSVAKLAEKSSISKTHFINRFRKATGLPPLKFQNECRIRTAKELLRATDLPIADIALQMGFCSHQHFSDMFARLVGTSPSLWRAKG